MAKRKPIEVYEIRPGKSPGDHGAGPGALVIDNQKGLDGLVPGAEFYPSGQGKNIQVAKTINQKKPKLPPCLQ